MTRALVKVQVPVKAFMGEVSAKRGNTKVTLHYVAKTRNIQVIVTAALEEDVFQEIVKLEKQRVQDQSAPPNGKTKGEKQTPAGKVCPDEEEEQRQKSKVLKLCLPTDQAYAAAMDSIADTVTGSLEGYPSMRDQALEAVQKFVPDGESRTSESASPWTPGSEWTMGDDAKGEGA